CGFVEKGSDLRPILAKRASTHEKIHCPLSRNAMIFERSSERSSKVLACLSYEPRTFVLPPEPVSGHPYGNEHSQTRRRVRSMPSHEVKLRKTLGQWSKKHHVVNGTSPRGRRILV